MTFLDSIHETLHATQWGGWTKKHYATAEDDSPKLTKEDKNFSRKSGGGDAVLTYHANNMAFAIHNNALYLNEI